MKKTRHSFLINASPEAILAVLMQEKHTQKWWSKEARVKDGKGVFSWSGYGWTER